MTEPNYKDLYEKALKTVQFHKANNQELRREIQELQQQINLLNDCVESAKQDLETSITASQLKNLEIACLSQEVMNHNATIVMLKELLENIIQNK